MEYHFGTDSERRPLSVGFLGPSGTFTEEALISQPDLAGARHVPLASFLDVLAAVEDGRTDYGLVAIENSIEGSVAVTVDELAHKRAVFIHREVVLSVTQNLLAVPGATAAGITQVMSFGHALGQCRAWLADHLPHATLLSAASTAQAAHLVGAGGRSDLAAIGPRLAATRYGLSVLAADVADHRPNSTRFVLVAAARRAIPGRTGDDKTTVACFPAGDRPGSVHDILRPFSARNLTLTKVEARPTRTRLGSYWFLVDLEGHIDDEIVADSLRELHATIPTLKFLGSYPSATRRDRNDRAAHGKAEAGLAATGSAAGASRRTADAWMADLRAGVVGRSPRHVA